MPAVAVMHPDLLFDMTAEKQHAARTLQTLRAVALEFEQTAALFAGLRGETILALEQMHRQIERSKELLQSSKRLLQQPPHCDI